MAASGRLYRVRLSQLGLGQPPQPSTFNWSLAPGQTSPPNTLKAAEGGLGEGGDTRKRLRPRLCSNDYLNHFIWPTPAAGVVRPKLVADCAWVDVSTVRSHALYHYDDAFWVPFSTSHSFAAWHRASLCAARDSKCAPGGMGARVWLGNLVHVQLIAKPGA
ncbi:hypothetical protein Q4I30_005981 [Leishmania utingensis]|uniref:Uncharacterized protein n=1 Tax=Leishmania utingensis TaxID=653362 RepID=A0AAW3A508_9TRYP